MKVHTPGTRLGQFEVVSYPVFNDITLDYICLDHEKLCPALLKTLNPESLSSQMARDCFAQCGATWVDLSPNPHIVRCHKVFTPENTDETYCVLQVVIPERQRDSTSLASWFSPGTPFPVLQALLFALQIVRGMRHITDELPGSVHGDLKPENILVSGGRLSQMEVNRLRVTDFGLVAALRASDVNLSGLIDTKGTAVARTQLINEVVGTPMYMSPEQWQCESISCATDVYALGCILYKMVVGRHPVAGETTRTLQNAHSTGNMRPLPVSLPQAVRDLVTRCLALEPVKRYQSWDELEKSIANAYTCITHFSIPLSEPMDTPTKSERELESWFLDSLGNKSSESGNMDTAIKCLELALNAGSTNRDQALVGTATNNLGEVYQRLGDVQRAFDYHNKALAIAVEIGNRSLEGSALNGKGCDFLLIGNPDQAIEHLNRALAVAREIGNKEGEVTSLVNLGNVYHQLGDLHRSIQYYEQGLKVARKIGDRRGESAALTNLGGVYSELGDNQRAIQYQEQSLTIKSEIGDRHAFVSSLINLGNAHRNLAQERQALKYYNEALEIAQDIDDHYGEASALNNMGSTYAIKGDMERALEHHEQALKIFREIGDRRGESDCLTNIGFIYKSRKDIQQAEQTCEQALVIDREVGDMFGLALDSFNMANLLVEQSCLSEALPYAEEATRILEKVGHTDKAQQARRMVDWIHAELASQKSEAADTSTTVPVDLRHQIQKIRADNPQITASMSDEEIITLLQQADLTWEHGKPMKFYSQRPEEAPGLEFKPDRNKMSAHECGVFGEQLLETGQWPEAERYFLTQLEKGKEEVNLDEQAIAYSSLGNIYCFQGNRDQALMLYRRALSLAEQAHNFRLIGIICNDIGELYRNQNDYPQAIAYYNKSLEIALQLGNMESQSVVYGNLGIVYKNQGKFEQAAHAYKKSLDYSIGAGIDRLTANQYGNLGVLYGLQEHYAEAVEMHEKALQVYLRLGNQKGVANTYGNLGIVYFELGKFQEAKEMYEMALKIMLQMGDMPGTSLTYGNLAVLYETTGELEKALESYNKALPILERIGDMHNSARFHNNLGLLYSKQGQLSQAHDHLQQALKLFQTVGDEQGVWKVAEELKKL